MTAVALSRIIEHVRSDLAQRQECIDYATIKRMADDAPPPLDGTAALYAPGVSVIGEIKRACPTRGPLATIPNPGQQAASYVEAGARIVSVQTERHYFHGSLLDVDDVRRNVSVPLLIKDYIVTPYQVHEARAHGADMVQLIVEALEPHALSALLDRVESLGMTAVVEVHSVSEAEIAMSAGAKVLAINARHLTTNIIDRSIFGEISSGLPSDILRIGEAGIRSPRDLLACAGAGIDAVLVGEGIVTARDPAAVLSALVIAGTHPSCPARS